jgi:serine/threonine protein kinase
MCVLNSERRLRVYCSTGAPVLCVGQNVDPLAVMPTPGNRCAGQPAPVSLSLKYAAPEVVRAYEASEQTIVVDASMDMWSLGIMAFELLTEEPVFPPYTSAADVCDQVAGRKPLPWESPDGDEKLNKLRMLRRSLVKCLSRHPSERPTSRELLASWNRLFDVVGDQTMRG